VNEEKGALHMDKRRFGCAFVLALLLTFGISSTAFAGKGPEGLVKEGTETYYYQDGVKQKGWQRIDGKKYFFRFNNARMVKGRFAVKGTVYYFNTRGVCVKKIPDASWETDEKGIRFCDGADKYLKNGWKTIQGKKYYFDKKGYVLTGIQSVKGYTYYFTSKGVMKTNKWVRANGGRYYFGTDGRMVRNAWVGDAYLGDDGRQIKDYVDETKDNPRKTGWVGYGRLWRYYVKGRLVTGWRNIEGKRYYFQSTGYMKIGWYNDGQNYYFLNTTPGRGTIGVMATNFMRIDGKVYYFFPKQVKDSTGKVHPKGSMARGLKIRYNDKEYSFDAQGVCQELK